MTENNIQPELVSLKKKLAIVRDDTTRVLILADLALQSSVNDFDACIKYSKQGIDLAQKIEFKRGEVRVLANLAGGITVHGDVPKSMALLFRALQTAEENHYPFETALC